MKNLKYFWMLCLALLSVGFTACNEDDEYFESDAQNSPIVISKIYLEDAESSVPDREVTFARLGQIIRVEGSGLFGIKKVYVNGYDTYFNREYVSDNSMLFQLNSKTPVVDAEEDVRNTIRFVKDGTETTFGFTIRAASPSIRLIDITLPKAGEKVTVYGTNLHETTLVTLPDGTQITDITSDEDGEWYSFTMPSGITAAGSITSEGANGTAITPAYFNENRCMILDFDGNGTHDFWSWKETGSMCDDEHDEVADPLNSGRGRCALLVPERMLAEGGVISGKSRASEWWAAGEGDDWTRMFDVIPATTPVSEIAYQFDIYVPEAWSGTGQLQVCLFNNYNFSGIGSDDDNDPNAVAFFVPYIQDGAIVPYSTTGWQTVTIPLSQFNKYGTLIEDGETPTFQMIIDDHNGAKYKQFGMGFVNTDFTYGGVTIESSQFNKRIYLDNWRFVPCKNFTVSDYPEDEE